VPRHQHQPQRLQRRGHLGQRQRDAQQPLQRTLRAGASRSGGGVRAIGGSGARVGGGAGVGVGVGVGGLVWRGDGAAGGDEAPHDLGGWGVRQDADLTARPSPPCSRGGGGGAQVKAAAPRRGVARAPPY
jgi:hypothetical protein